MNQSEKNKICIYGGTFNPLHLGHIEMARVAKALYGFDKVIILPTGGSYLKNNVLDSKTRYDMVELALKDIEGFEVSDIEVKREGPSYTFETLGIFEKLYPDCRLYFLIGEDSLRYMDKWRETQIIFDKAHILVAKRKSVYKNDDRNTIFDVKEDLLNKYKGEISIFDFDNDISSTYIREHAHLGDFEAIKDKVPECIYKYIKDKRLY